MAKYSHRDRIEMIMAGEDLRAVMNTIEIVAATCVAADELGVPPVFAIMKVAEGLKSGELDLSGGDEEE